MSLPLSERKKLVSMLQQKFPLAKQWKENVSGYSFSSWKKFALFSGLLFGGVGVASALIRFGILNDNVNYVLPGTMLWIVVLPVFMGWAGGTWNSVKRYKINKKREMYKEQMRDYVRQNTCLRKVKVLLREVSEDDLKLLSANPNLNPLFKECFAQEFQRRDDLQTVEKIHTEFLSETIQVEQKTEHQPPTKLYAVEKVHI